MAEPRQNPLRSNPLRGRVVSDGDTQASLGNVANIVTVVRILCAPVFVWLLLSDGDRDGWLRWAAAALFLVAILTDSVDGFLARRQNLVTDFGKLVDPIADKILVGAALVGLSVLGELWWWVTALILLREGGITVFRFVALRDRVIPASLAGKVKTWAQSVAVAVMLVPLDGLVGTGWLWLGWILMAVALALTVYSGLEYLVQARRTGRARRTG
ncbi:MAG: CDP-diacylglycerol--glycerol-3-phosphate 3-phosphatidyltransferase [Micrococcales bacterium]|nr:CDP-diacylglycerol--glycerol-3-phosphate 3-phosphatidyltransferase [Micrococcales bacterium]